jgi:predicted neuraminidase/CMP-2-keto-3-deoxyoctulosonic acid synthetase
MSTTNVAGIIPARYASSRLPGKPLALILGKPMIQHVYEQCLKSKTLDQIYVATDDTRIDEGVKPLLEDPTLEISTLMYPIKSKEDLHDIGVVKTVVNLAGDAMYFSRSLIPYPHKNIPHGVYEHIRLYVYRTPTLHKIAALTLTTLEEVESLELLNNLHEQLDDTTKIRLDNAANKIVTAKKNNKKVVVVTGSGPNVHEGVTTLIAELMRLSIIDGVSTSLAVVAHEMGGTLDKVKRCNRVELGLDSTLLPRGDDFELTQMSPEVAEELATNMDIDQELIEKLNQTDGKIIIKAAGNLGYPMGLWIERLSAEITTLARKHNLSFEDVAGLGADPKTMIGIGAQLNLPGMVTIPQLVGGGATGLGIGDSISITERASRLAHMLDSADVIIESGVALTQEIHDGPLERYTGHGLWSAWDDDYSYSLESKSLIRIDLDPALEQVYQVEQGDSAVQQAIADGLPKTKMLKVPFRMEMSGFARHEGSIPIIGDIGTIWPLIALKVSEQLTKKGLQKMLSKKYILTILCTLILPLAQAQEPNVTSSKSFIKQVTQAGGHVNYAFGDTREFAQCHASTIVQAADGSLICAWFGGTEEKGPDVSVWMSTFKGNNWSAPIKAAKVDNTAHWNPVLFRDNDDIIHHFFKIGVDEIHWCTYWSLSKDNGTTWSTPQELVKGDIGGRGPVKNKAIFLHDGTWLAPASIEYKEGKREVWKAFADRSEDQGNTWTRSANFLTPPAPDEKRNRKFKGVGATQPTFWESTPGNIHALLRTGSGKVWRTDSTDNGLTWTPYHVTDLPNNNSGLDALKLPDGRIVLIYNPVDRNWGARTPLDIAISSDNGTTWETIAHLEDDPDPDSEYSYPAIVKTENGIAISYTWNRTNIRCWQIPDTLLN